jgi:conjugative transfer pilus assembly protein TraH
LGCRKTGLRSRWREVKNPGVQKSSREEYKSILAEEFNVAWEVIRRNNFLNADRDLACLCMTITGTIVSHKDGGKGRVIVYPSRASSDAMIKALLEGGKTEIYSCSSSEPRCLNVNVVETQIPAANSFLMKVRKMLGEINQKAQNDEAFSPGEIAFIENTRLPLYKMINVMGAYKRSEFDLRDFTEIVCIDFVHQYITEILDLALAEAVNLRNAQVSEEEISKFIKQLQEARANINTKRMSAWEQMNQALLMIESTKIYERKVENAFDELQRGSR